MAQHRLVHGRHRAPPPPSRPRMRVALVGGALLAPGIAAMLPDAASAATPLDRSVLGPIARCESAGNPRASNGTHFGLFQFDIPTWRSVGGQGHPINATVAEQKLRAGLLLDARGTQPWIASQRCWSGLARGPVVVRFAPKPKPAVRPAPRATVKPKPRPALRPTRVAPKPRVVVPARTAPRRVPIPVGHITVRRGDTLSELAFARHISMRRIHGFRSGNPDLIFPGERLTVS